ncbi:hypothetical protein [Allomesorhizobium alhagi]|uniref:Secreted protein n=1 Tax=Mesorhizobium alhagi CCNWXJ12-2 TaxID=1107882 RepID=H0HUR5_9HYPH|nr:hypothetical protein [Mesorhizobium alhagi]EHK55501.1 hypothetical protein MAXJ12_19578 [Mesorhizobium alhagi CCNWXJ12-2]
MIKTKHAVRRLAFTAGLAVAAMVASPAYAFELSDGTYVAKFPRLRNACGNLTITDNGSKIKYTAGECGGTTTYRRNGSFDGETISIQAARLKLSGSSSNNISGRWSLGKYVAKLSFNRQ